MYVYIRHTNTTHMYIHVYTLYTFPCMLYVIVMVYTHVTLTQHTQAGYSDSISNEGTGHTGHGDTPEGHYGNVDTQPGEDLESVMRRHQAAVTELLAKCGEVLRSVITTYMYTNAKRPIVKYE